VNAVNSLLFIIYNTFML